MHIVWSDIIYNHLNDILWTKILRREILSRTQIISRFCNRCEKVTEEMGARCHHCPKQAISNDPTYDDSNDQTDDERNWCHHSFFKNDSRRARPSADVRPHQAGEAYRRREMMVASITVGFLNTGTRTTLSCITILTSGLSSFSRQADKPSM